MLQYISMHSYFVAFIGFYARQKIHCIHLSEINQNRKGKKVTLMSRSDILQSRENAMKVANEMVNLD